MCESVVVVEWCRNDELTGPFRRSVLTVKPCKPTLALFELTSLVLFLSVKKNFYY